MTNKYRGAKSVVTAAMMYPIKATQGGQVMCKNRSPVLSACQALIRHEITAIRYGGVVRNSVVTLSFPRPFITLTFHSQEVIEPTDCEFEYLRGEQSCHGAASGATVDDSENEPSLDVPVKKLVLDIALFIRESDGLLECQLEPMESGLVFAVHPVLLSNIGLQPPSRNIPFLLIQPSRSSRKVGQAEEGNKSHYYLFACVSIPFCRSS
jgi:hypothetical protein